MVTKRKSSTEIWENTPKVKKGERVFISYPSEEMIDVTKKSEESKVIEDYKKVSEIMLKHGGKPYRASHQHIVRPNEMKQGKKNLPSSADFWMFLANDDQEIDRIVQFNAQKKKVEGYFVIRKTARTPKSGISFTKELAGYDNDEDVDSKLREIFAREYDGKIVQGVLKYEKGVNTNVEEAFKALKGITEKFNLQIKYLPAKGFEYVDGRGFFLKKAAEIQHEEQKKSLESKVIGITGIISLIAGLFFLFSTSGNIQLSPGQSLINWNLWIGIFLLVLGLGCGIFWFWKKRKK